MKNLKKITALVIVLAMALSSVAFAATFTDVSEDASYNEAVQIMTSLGLLVGYEDGTFGPDKTITRAEFAAVMVRAMNMEDAAKGASVNTGFTDVPADHWSSGYVAVASQAGLILGYGDGTFGPDNEVLYEEAIKMIVCALGYAPKFEGTPDAYPTAYMAQANADGVTVGAAGKIGDKASRATVARLVYNSLTVPMMVQISFGGRYGDEYGVPSDEAEQSTLLSSKLKIAKVEGTVTANYFGKDEADQVSLDIVKTDIHNSFSNISEIDVGAQKLAYDPSVDTKSVKGYYSVIYIDTANEIESTIKAIAPKQGKNKTLKITKEQAYKMSDTNANELEYWKNNDDDARPLKVKLDETNFKAYDNNNTQYNDLDAFKIEYNREDKAFDEIDLIDSNNDGKYDYAYLKKHYAFVVGEISERVYRVMADDKSGTAGGTKIQLSLDPESETTYSEIVDKDGKALKFEDIKVGDVVNVFESKDDSNNTYQKVVVTNDTVTGMVESEDTDGKYTIGDSEYETTIALKTGDKGTFTVDMYGTILMKTLEDTVLNYGFVYGVQGNTKDFNKEAQVLMLNTKGEFVTMNFGKNVKVNSDDTVPSEDFVDKDGVLKSVEALGNKTIKEVIENCLVIYETNGSNQITGVYSTTAGMRLKEDGFRAYEAGDYVYNAVSNKMSGDNTFYVEEDTNIFRFKNADFSGDKSKADFSVINGSAFADEEPYKMIAIVDKNDGNTLKAGVVLNMKGSVAADSPVMFVTGYATSKDSDENDAITLKGVVNGEATEIIVSSENTDVVRPDGNELAYDAISTGSVVQFSGTTEASVVNVIMTGAEVANFTSAQNSPAEDEDQKESNYLGMTNAKGFLYGGTVEKIKSGIVSFDIGEVDNTLDLFVKNSVPTMLVRTANATGGGKVVSKAYTTDISLAVAETNTMVYDEDPDADDANDDIVIVYKYDGVEIFAVIVDADGDDQF